jgi:hypothetical protein
MRQLKRVLKPSDRLVIEEPNISAAGDVPIGISGSALPPVSFRNLRHWHIRFINKLTLTHPQKLLY